MSGKRLLETDLLTAWKNDRLDLIVRKKLENFKKETLLVKTHISGLLMEGYMYICFSRL